MSRSHQSPGDFAAKDEWGTHVDIEHTIDQIDFHLVRTLCIRNAGIVDKYCYEPEFGLSLRDACDHLIRIGRVHLDGDGVSTIFPYFVSQRLQTVETPGSQRDLGPALRKDLGKTKTKPGRCASHKRSLP
jgi:hypothetical protein